MEKREDINEFSIPTRIVLSLLSFFVIVLIVGTLRSNGIPVGDVPVAISFALAFILLYPIWGVKIKRVPLDQMSEWDKEYVKKMEEIDKHIEGYPIWVQNKEGRWGVGIVAIIGGIICYYLGGGDFSSWTAKVVAVGLAVCALALSNEYWEYRHQRAIRTLVRDLLITHNKETAEIDNYKQLYEITIHYVDDTTRKDWADAVGVYREELDKSKDDKADWYPRL